MSDFVIQVAQLGKQYPIGGKRRSYETLRESVADFCRQALPGRGAETRQTSQERFWALRDVSLEVKRGEVVGVIGRNGAGKSTLLKILSRVTEPTRGWAELRGRLGSLLEVGAGFHAELSGRENVLLSGAMLGMRRAEVLRKFDEIVAFAELDRFVDTPVKHYSSGMYLRLGFAVAAHLETDILLVDEVLAVGDSAFQNKCVARMRNLATEGRTALFVSHNMALVRDLCRRAYLLNGGAVEAEGETAEVLDRYLLHTELGARNDLRSLKNRRGLGSVRLHSLHFEDQQGRPLRQPGSGSYVRFVVKLESRAVQRNVRVCVFCSDEHQQQVLYLNSLFSGPEIASLSTADELVCEVPKLHLAPGKYRVGLWIQTSGTTLQDRVDDVGTIEVVDGGFFSDGVGIGRGVGVALMEHRWSARPAACAS